MKKLLNKLRPFDLEKAKAGEPVYWAEKDDYGKYVEAPNERSELCFSFKEYGFGIVLDPASYLRMAPLGWFPTRPDSGDLMPVYAGDVVYPIPGKTSFLGNRPFKVKRADGLGGIMADGPDGSRCYVSPRKFSCTPIAMTTRLVCWGEKVALSTPALGRVSSGWILNGIAEAVDAAVAAKPHRSDRSKIYSEVEKTVRDIREGWAVVGTAPKDQAEYMRRMKMLLKSAREAKTDNGALSSIRSLVAIGVSYLEQYGQEAEKPARAPLCEVEGKPVYPGDVLYWNDNTGKPGVKFTAGSYGDNGYIKGTYDKSEVGFSKSSGGIHYRDLTWTKPLPFLGQVEGRPVRKGDVLYWNHKTAAPGKKFTAESVGGSFLIKGIYEPGDGPLNNQGRGMPPDQLTWTKSQLILCHIEGKPVHQGDELYTIKDGLKVKVFLPCGADCVRATVKPDEAHVYFLHELTWTKPATSDGWIEWNGGECPVPQGTLVDVEFRNGRKEFRQPALTSGFSASAPYWRHDGIALDIVAYRVCNLRDFK